MTFFSDVSEFTIKSEIRRKEYTYLCHESPRTIHELPTHGLNIEIWCAVSVRKVIGPSVFRGKKSVFSPIKSGPVIVTEVLFVRGPPGEVGLQVGGRFGLLNVCLYLYYRRRDKRKEENCLGKNTSWSHKTARGIKTENVRMT